MNMGMNSMSQINGMNIVNQMQQMTQQQMQQIMQQQYMMQMMMPQNHMHCCSINNYCNNNASIINNDKKDKKDFSVIDLIMSQNAMEWFWDENEGTKNLIDILSTDIFGKIKNKVISLNKREKETKIIYTILVIYYLKNNLVKKLNEYKLVINKANKFLKENGIDYNNIISGI